MLCHSLKIPIARQHPQTVANAQLRQNRVDSPNLNAIATACIAKRSRFDMIRPVRDEEGKCGKPVQNLRARFRSREALEKLLQYQAGGQHQLAVMKRLGEGGDLGDRRGLIPA